MGGRALITGVAGQDGTYLADLLLGKGYEVFGVAGPGIEVPARTGEHQVRMHLIEADVTDTESILAAIGAAEPTEIYNLASLSSVGSSWAEAVTTAEVNAVGVLRLLEVVRLRAPGARLFQASTAEMFGNASAAPQDETAGLDPRSPYAAAKAYAHYMVRIYRQSYGLHASSGILFNHESPLRPPQFVTRHITQGVAAIKRGLADELLVGNLDARRDWGFAGDYVEAMWLMLQQPSPDDYVVATGIARTVREFCEAAFSHVGLDYRDHVRIDPSRFRPIDVDVSCGDASKARRVLGWEPRVGFQEMVAMMVDADLERLAVAEHAQSSTPADSASDGAGSSAH